MKIVVIGGSGHIGTFLVPRLVRAGHEVVSISRGQSSTYADAPEWDAVERVAADREQQDRDGTFGATVLAQSPEVVIDLVCFTPESASALVDALRGEVAHLLHCGSIWRHGRSRKLPIAEHPDTTEDPTDEYGLGKKAIARLLKEETRSGGLVTTSLHPGHIVGPGWNPIGPLGNLDPTVWRTLATGGTLAMPGSGTEMMHHVHADDVAHGFEQAVSHRDAAAGEDFTVVAPTALSVRGFADIAASWFGREATLESIGWDAFRASTEPEHADASWGHLDRSQCFTIEKAQRLLDYTPRYEPEAAVLESIRWLIDHDELDPGAPLVE
ncbi:nucleoside-diphosphate-sugar epimerase [Labedella gwakjiensis]|uniref:NAD(P)-dependent oxidoreductase n=1 Tax=Labedella gwakjiensis TaxID=390269 RepID=A0A2P8GW90_9MICO|nr:NAD(P)-dependent oxidoreductase [Labedella gwakjiensis]PSL38228.1 nucleoside-diphosphate-sugar epimerase [Labedella gwakjiensis]RUQ87232.1 NAD(P)-dependent oxidoreductase [Labedella gwakjiensis]